MALLTPSDVHIDAPLTNLTLAYMQSQDVFIADKVFPNVSVPKQTDKFYIYDAATAIRSGDVKALAPRTEAQRIGMKLSTSSYFTDVYGLGMDFSEQDLANEDTMLQTRVSGAETLVQRMLIDREQKFATQFFTSTGVWDTDYTGVSGSPSAGQVRQWNDYTNSTPIVDITKAATAVQLASGGFKPNTLVVGKEVYDELINNPDIIARLNGGSTVNNPAMVTKAKLAEIFDVEYFYVMNAVHNSAKEGQTASNAFIGGKSALLCYTPSSAGLRVPASGLTFTWDSLPGVGGLGVTVESFSDGELRRKQIAEYIQAKLAYDMKIVGSALGAFFTTVVA